MSTSNEQSAAGGVENIENNAGADNNNNNQQGDAQRNYHSNRRGGRGRGNRGSRGGAGGNRESNFRGATADKHPTTLTGAFDMLQTYRGPRLNVRGGGRNQNQPRGEHNLGIQFAQTGGTIVAGRNGREFQESHA